MITLVLGGARSGKSEVAESLAAGLAAGGPVTYVATAVPEDAEMAARVEAHRRRRPHGWSTVEVAAGGDLAGAVAHASGVVLLDSLGPWLASVPDFSAPADRLCAALRGRRPGAVVVSDEVGLGVHPSTAAGRRFRDALGVLNRAVADAADRAVLVVAGRILELGRP